MDKINLQPNAIELMDNETATNLKQSQINRDLEGVTVCKQTPKGGRCSYLCDQCGFITTRKLTMVKHLQTHEMHKPFRCMHCEKTFSDSTQLGNHMNLHLGFKPYKCEEAGCDLTFSTVGELQRHTRYRHTKDKPHKCDQCSYATVELNKLKRHMRMHTNERPFLCTYCDYASRDTFRLKRHMRIHTGERPYVCPICSFSANQSNTLKGHMRLHDNPNSTVYKKTMQQQLKQQQMSGVAVVASTASVVASAVTGAAFTVTSQLATSSFEPNDQAANSPSSSLAESTQKRNKKTVRSYLENANPILNSVLEFEIKNSECSTTIVTELLKEFIEISVRLAEEKIERKNTIELEKKEERHNMYWFVCKHCSSSFLTEVLLREHLAKQHTGERLHKCDQCGVCFSHPHALRQHILNHDRQSTYYNRYVYKPRPTQYKKRTKSPIQALLEAQKESLNSALYAADSNSSNGSRVENFENKKSEQIASTSQCVQPAQTEIGNPITSIQDESPSGKRKMQSIENSLGNGASRKKRKIKELIWV
jgi:uncharacterized Zn-finger protein